MATDTSRGIVRFFEDFVGTKVIADKPEYGVDTDPAVEVLSGGLGGVVRITMDAGQTNIGGFNVGTLQWSAYDNYLEFEARVKMSAIGTGAERFFVGFTDVQEDTLTEMPFTGATTVLTAAADPDDAIGFFFEGDMTDAYWVPASLNTSAVVIDGATNMTADQKRLAKITAGQWHTLTFRIQSDAKHVEFFVDGKSVYVYKSATQAAIADVNLIPEVVVTEGTSAVNFDIDYVAVEAGRDN